MCSPSITPAFACATLLVLVSISCGDSDKTGDTALDSGSPYVYRDTGLWLDTSPQQADTAPPQDTAQEVVMESLALYPVQLTVEPGASFATRAVATMTGELLLDVEPSDCPITSSAPDVATVSEDGSVQALAPGDAILTASCLGQEANATIHVTEPGSLQVTVVDASTGSPLEGAMVVIGDTGVEFTDSAGFARLETSTGEGVNLSVWDDDHLPLTIMGTVSRELTVAITTYEDYQDEGATFSGNVDFSSVMEGAWDQVVAGLVVSSVQGNPMFMDIESLVYDEREIEFYGWPLTIPANVVVKSVAEDYSASASTGSFGAWSLAGPVGIADLTAAVSNVGDVLELLVNNLDNFSYGWTGLYEAETGGSLALDISPDHSFSEVVQVMVPDLPLGFSGDETPMVFILDEAPDDVFAVVGLGRGRGEVAALRAPEGVVAGAEHSWALVMAQVGGIGSGGAVACSMSELSAAYADPPSLLDVPTIDYFDGSTHEFALETDSRADLVGVVVEGGGGELRQVYLDRGAITDTLPASAFDFSYGETTWTLRALETTVDTFEGFASSGRLSDGDLKDILLGSVELAMSFEGTGGH